MAWLNAADASLVPVVQTQPVAGINTPGNPTASASGSGATLPAGNYYVKTTGQYSITFNGRTFSQETTPSGEVGPIAVTAGQSLTITASAFSTGENAQNVYVSTSSGQETYQGQITSSGGTLTINAPLSTTAKSPATTNFPNGNLNPPASATGGQILYQAPSVNANVTSPSTTAIIKEITATNTDTTAGATDWLSLYIVAPGDLANVANAYQFYELPINAMDSKCLSGLNKAMLPGSTIQAVQQNAGKITLDISVSEVQ